MAKNDRTFPKKTFTKDKFISEIRQSKNDKLLTNRNKK